MNKFHQPITFLLCGVLLCQILAGGYVLLDGGGALRAWLVSFAVPFPVTIVGILRLRHLKAALVGDPSRAPSGFEIRTYHNIQFWTAAFSPNKFACYGEDGKLAGVADQSGFNFTIKDRDVCSGWGLLDSSLIRALPTLDTPALTDTEHNAVKHDAGEGDALGVATLRGEKDATIAWRWRRLKEARA